MAALGCEHKHGIGCALTVLPVCCSCADRRPQSTEGYPDYIDGIGMTLSGRRWTKYCSRCREYWGTEPRRDNVAPAREQPSWEFPPRHGASNLPVRSRPAPPGVRVRGARPIEEEASTEDDQPRPFPPNPFGTREELAADDWVSPITSMFVRAHNYREAEIARRQRHWELQQHLHAAPGEDYPPIRQRTSPSPPRANPIDEQSRPPSLPGSDMVVNIACRICNEQRIDTLMEPCMHACMCHWCSEIIRDQAQRSRRRRRAGFGDLEQAGAPDRQCPICRHGVSGVRRIFLG